MDKTDTGITGQDLRHLTVAMLQGQLAIMGVVLTYIDHDTTTMWKIALAVFTVLFGVDAFREARKIGQRL